MPLIKRGTRRVTALATLLVLTLAGVAAFAYWTISGEGTGEAHVSNPTSSLKVESTPVEGLFPGGSKEVTVTVKNVGAAGAVHTETLESALTGNSKEGVGCQRNWFTITPASQALVKELSAGESETATVTVSMAPATSENQNSCKGATVFMHFIAQ